MSFTSASHRTYRDFTPEEKLRWEQAVAEVEENKEAIAAEVREWIEEERQALEPIRAALGPHIVECEREYAVTPTFRLQQKIFLLKQIQSNLDRQPSFASLLSCARMMGKRLSLKLSDD